MEGRKEFGGRLGTTVFTFTLPLFTYYLVACAYSGHLLIPTSLSPDALQTDVIDPVIAFVSNHCQFDWISLLLYSVWFLIQLIFDQFLSGQEVCADSYYKDKQNANIKYQINGWKAWMSTHVIAFIITFVFNLQDLIISRLYSLMTIALIYAWIIAVIAYYVGYTQQSQQSSQASQSSQSSSGCNPFDFVYDFWMGYTKYPSVKILPGDSAHRLHLKLFCEARPGLQLWILFNYLLFYDYYVKFDHFNIQMACVCLMQWWYITDYFWFEDAILTTMDLIHEKFGFMLSYGDLVWVPWTYTLQMQTLYFYYVKNPAQVPKLARISDLSKADAISFFEFDGKMSLYWWSFIMMSIFFTGYMIFRRSNLQKHLFRKLCASAPKGSKDLDAKQLEKLSVLVFNGEKIEYIIASEKSGSKLLVCGWWAVGRHMNYTGDWLMTLAQAMICDHWSLLVPPANLISYFNCIYFAILLVHRAQRDDIRCKHKYGKKWDEYCRRVPYVLVPYVY